MQNHHQYNMLFKNLQFFTIVCVFFLVPLLNLVLTFYLVYVALNIIQFYDKKNAQAIIKNQQM